MKTAILSLALAALLAVPLAAQEVDHSAMGHDMAASDDPVVQKWIEVNDRMHAGMAIEFSGNPDIDFVRGMIAHHIGAVEMARVVIEHGTDPQIRALAEEIVVAQEAEIEMMRAWLEEHATQ